MCDWCPIICFEVGGCWFAVVTVDRIYGTVRFRNNFILSNSTLCLCMVILWMKYACYVSNWLLFGSLMRGYAIKLLKAISLVVFVRVGLICFDVSHLD